MIEAPVSEITLHFSVSGHPPVRVPPNANLSELLTVEDSPMLFGCRTGICGTCLVRAEAVGGGALPPLNEAEKDLLPILAPGDPQARLACQLRLTCDARIEKL